MNKFERMYNPCGLRIPEKLNAKTRMRFGSRFIAPDELLLDGYATPVEDQGAKPYCAAYAASNFAESVLWRRDGYPKAIDPDPLYAHAKTIDGDPTGDGTYLECTLDALLEKRYFDRSVCKVKTFGGGWFGNDFHSALEAVKMAVFQYGGCIIGCDIDTSWYTPTAKGALKGGGQSLGGHAICAAGYDEGGIVIVNSWGESWGHGGKAYLPNDVLKKQLVYGAVITNCLNGME